MATAAPGSAVSRAGAMASTGGRSDLMTSYKNIAAKLKK